MKQALTIALCFIAMSIIAQPVNSDEVNYIISIQNAAGEPLKNQEITATNSKTPSEVHTKFTTEKGKIKFILRRGETYSIEYLNENFSATIPINGTSFMTKKIVYQGQISVTKPTVLDTIIFKKVPREPSATEALFQLVLKNKEGKVYKYLDVWMVQPTINKVYYTKTNSKGYATFKLPIGYDYQVNFKRDENYRTITVPKQPNLRFRKGFTYTSNFMDITEVVSNDTIFQTVALTQKATLKRALIKVTVLDLDGNPLEEEKVYLQGVDKVYTAETNADGQTALLLPKGKYYAINFEYRDSLEVLNIEAGNYTRTDNIRYKYLGTKAIKARIAERIRNQIVADSLARVMAYRDSIEMVRYAILRDSLLKVQAIRDSILQIRNDSLLRVQAVRDSLLLISYQNGNFMGQFKTFHNTQTTCNNIQQRALNDLRNVEKNPDYFKEKKEEVLSVLYRNRKRWRSKFIITDMTCSMHPYFDQIIVWHALEMNLRDEQRFDNRYMFFNDGNGKSMSEKILGKTGGFHYSTESPTLENLLPVIKRTTSTGCSGDGPENDFEALINGIDKRKIHTKEIILIADNNSEVRDFELLKYIKVPVRIVLAGSIWDVNEQYLELAYKTKGSVHTIEDDIENLFELNDGESIQIGNNSYRISGGKFLKN
ncbi:MAG: carboxypeptidase-like regulatory domain-containing protein [Saprospiraceae bacterium]